MNTVATWIAYFWGQAKLRYKTIQYDIVLCSTSAVTLHYTAQQIDLSFTIMIFQISVGYVSFKEQNDTI